MTTMGIDWKEIGSSVDSNGEGVDSHNYRTMVPGGWLVMSIVYNNTGMAFVPDPKHEWKVGYNGQ